MIFIELSYEQLPKRTIFCVDMKSFYASCAAVALGLDPLQCHLAVVGDKEKQGSVILAATPALKKDFNIKTGNRLFEVPNDSRIQLVNASMATYLTISIRVTELFQQYLPAEAIHTYSIDESFLDVKGTSRLWGNEWELAEHIRESLNRRLGLSCSIGIGPNMLMAKVCLDIEAKKTGVSKWTYDDVEKKLWLISPLKNMWGIGARTEHRLNRMGIFSIGQLAKYPLAKLEKSFGIIGNQLYYHAWGVDLSELGAPILNGQISYGKSQILLRDYTDTVEIRRVLLEMSEEVASRARKANKVGQTVTLGIGYSKQERQSGFHRQTTLYEPTNITMEIYQACLNIFEVNYNGSIVRQISITLANIFDDHSLQLNFFEPDRTKQYDLGHVMDEIREKHGPNAILRTVSYAEGGTARHRNTLLGGHKT